MPEKHTQKHSHTAHYISASEAQAISLVKSGTDYFTRALDIINRSKEKLHLQAYIFIDDSTGKQIIEALKKAVERGVKVFVLVDAFGSFAMSNEAIRNIKKSNINFRTFSPLFVSHRIRFGRRLHHKILVADECEALVGGINIEEKYHIKKNNNTPWLDYAVYIKGHTCTYLDYICEGLWKGRFYRRWKKHPHLKTEGQQSKVRLWIRRNDWARKKDGISRSVRSALKHSDSSITIIGSYFLPGRRMRKLLKKAAERKVKIKLILQGTSDVSLVKKASDWWYTWLLRNNIEVYEWTETVLHGKLMLIDKHWVSIGSYNINHLSDYASIETNIEIHNPEFCHTVHEEMERVMKASKHITSSENRLKMKPLEQFSCWLSFHTVRILFWIQFLLLSKE